jgi:hypothetical protein
MPLRPMSGAPPSDVRRRPVRRMDESDLLQQIYGSAHSLHRVQHCRHSQRPIGCTRSRPRRSRRQDSRVRASVIPSARTQFGDEHRVRQPIARRNPVVDMNVLGADVEDRIAQGSHHNRNVRAHPHQMRGNEVRADDAATGRLDEAPFTQIAVAIPDSHSPDHRCGLRRNRPHRPFGFGCTASAGRIQILMAVNY